LVAIEDLRYWHGLSAVQRRGLVESYQVRYLVFVHCVLLVEIGLLFF
jgi:hypothetical protein